MFDVERKSTNFHFASFDLKNSKNKSIYQAEQNIGQTMTVIHIEKIFLEQTTTNTLHSE